MFFFAFQEFIKTLDPPMIYKLCVRSLRRGVGSMDHIHVLLLMEDDLDDVQQDSSHSDNYSDNSLDVDGQNPHPPPVEQASKIPWCKCGLCKIMPQEIENKCCGHKKCVTKHSRFFKLCLDPDVLQLAIRNSGDIRNDREDNSTRAFRKAAYRQFILDRYGYLGKGNRRVCPSCVVTAIRSKYPSQTGVYMGFKDS